MPTLINNSASTQASPWVNLPAGRWKLSADIPGSDGAAVTFEERTPGHTVTRKVVASVVDSGDTSTEDVTLNIDQPTHLYQTGWVELRCTRAGGSAPITVRAEAVPF